MTRRQIQVTKEDRERRFQRADKVHARWKCVVSGGGRFTAYRATCGAAQCPGHLGDLSYTTADGRSALWELLLSREEEPAEVRRRIARESGVYPRGEFRGWHLSPHRQDLSSLQKTVIEDADDPEISFIYVGFADTGFRISPRPGKQSRHGTIVGRRDVAFDRTRKYGEPREVIGAEVRPEDAIWCPIPSCGALNLLDWPEPLKDPAAR